MGVPIQVYDANREKFDEVEKAKLEDRTHGFGKPADTTVTNSGHVACHGPIYQASNEAAFNSFENARILPFRKM